TTGFGYLDDHITAIVRGASTARVRGASPAAVRDVPTAVVSGASPAAVENIRTVAAGDTSPAATANVSTADVGDTCIGAVEQPLPARRTSLERDDDGLCPRRIVQRDDDAVPRITPPVDDSVGHRVGM